VLRFEYVAFSAALGAGSLALFGCGGRSDRHENGAANVSGGTGAGAVGGDSGTGGSAPAGGTGPVLSQLAAQCQSLDTSNTNAVSDAKHCDPTKTNQCTASIDTGGVCGCTIFVNPANTDAIARVQATALNFQSLGCQGLFGECGVCAQAVSGRCDASGQCETVFGDEPGAGGSGGMENGSGGAGAGGRPGVGGAGGVAGMANGGSGGMAAGGAGGVDSTVCAAAVAASAQSFVDAGVCDPNADVEQCTQKVSEGIGCSCPAFVNPANSDAIAVLTSSAQQYQDAGCTFNAVCGACLAPIRGQCGADGHCMQVGPGSGRSCKVNGVVYADGESDIPSPVDLCNTCSCYDGNLACTLADCGPKPCPEGQSYGQACAECGPTDACDVIEYGCFWPCSAGCADRNLLCVNDMCVATACR